MIIKMFNQLSLALFLLSAAINTHAASLTVEGGQLISAWGVNVNGTQYDVEFKDGTCIELFDGCDQNSDFVFSTLAESTAASAALLDQVLTDSALGLFDTEPHLTPGCESVLFCRIITPHETTGIIALAAIATNTSGLTSDSLVGTSIPIDLDLTVFNSDTYAQWSLSPLQVPEPGSLALLVSGFVAFQLGRQRKRKREPIARQNF